MPTIHASELKAGDKVIRAGGVTFHEPETVVSVETINDNVWVQFVPHCGSTSGGEYKIRGEFSLVEIA